MSLTNRYLPQGASSTQRDPPFEMGSPKHAATQAVVSSTLLVMLLQNLWVCVLCLLASLCIQLLHGSGRLFRYAVTCQDGENQLLNNSSYYGEGHEIQLATLWTGDLEGRFPQKVNSVKYIQEDPQTHESASLQCNKLHCG